MSLKLIFWKSIVLEIGVFVGFSCMVWSHAIGPDGFVTGLESSEEFSKMAEDAFKDQGYGKIAVITGDAAKTCVSSPSSPRQPLQQVTHMTQQPPRDQSRRTIRPGLHRRQ
jgi:predicted O-methyltransferase YrrM